MTATFDHYRTYQPKPVSKEDVARVEILFGGLHWRAERVLEALFQNLGYRARALPTATRADLMLGREMADIGQCCPTSFTTGNLVGFLRDRAAETSPEAVVRDYTYLTAGSCGACRFGQYHQSYEMALRSIGLEDFRMFLMGQSKLDQGALAGGGIAIDLPMTLGGLWAVLVTDVLQSLEYQTRPYEVEPGATQRAVEKSVDQLCEAFRNRPHRGKKWGALIWHVSTDYFIKTLREVRKNFDAIEVDRLRCKPVVKITGEFYLQTVEGDPNYNIHAWLEQEGAEVVPAAVAVWGDYLLRYQMRAWEQQGGNGTKVQMMRGVRQLFRWTYNRMRGALGDIPHELPDQDELERLAAPYYNHMISGGEGDMLIGKAIWAHQNRKAHMICELSPYACMPNTMSVGAMAGVMGKHPDLLYAPIEIKGDAEVHALSRCQMILTEAKTRAIREYVAAMEASGLTPEDAKVLIDADPKLKSATYLLPRKGVAGAAAATLLHLAERKGRRASTRRAA